MDRPKKKGRPRGSGAWTAAKLNERSRAYFDKCDSRTRIAVVKDGTVEVPYPAPYSIEGLCVYLDIDRATFLRWRKLDNPLGKAAERAHLIVTANRVEGALDGRQNASFAQFCLKNNDPDHYRDKLEVESSVDPAAQSLLERAIGTWTAATLKN